MNRRLRTPVLFRSPPRLLAAAAAVVFSAAAGVTFAPPYVVLAGDFAGAEFDITFRKVGRR